MLSSTWLHLILFQFRLHNSLLFLLLLLLLLMLHFLLLLILMTRMPPPFPMTMTTTMMIHHNGSGFCLHSIVNEIGRIAQCIAVVIKFAVHGIGTIPIPS